MSYAQAMKWGHSHPKGTHQPIIMSTGSGFWPAHAWVIGTWARYVEQCKAAGIEPMECEAYYNAAVSGGAGDPRLSRQE